MSISGIYKIEHVDSRKCYIGSSINCDRRGKEHFRNLRNGIHKNVKLQNAWNKYGEGSFYFEVVEECENLRSKEQVYIDMLNPEYNIINEAYRPYGYKTKPVERYDLKGNFICEYKSVRDAARKNDIGHSTISQVCRGTRKTCLGSIFIFKGDELNLERRLIRLPFKKKGRGIIQKTLEGGFIRTWVNATKASKHLGLKRESGIVNCCKGISKSSAGFKWEYE